MSAWIKRASLLIACLLLPPAPSAARSYGIPLRPTARFTATPGVATIGQPVRFDASASSDADGDAIIEYRWRFGDHSSLTTTTPVVEHTYAHAGVALVRLIVVDSHGRPSQPAARAITIVRPPPPQITGLRLKVCTHRTRHCPRRGLRLRFTLSSAATIVITVRRRHHRRVLRRVVFGDRAGDHSKRIRFKGKPGRHYVVTVRPLGGRALTKRFVWRRR